MTKCVDRELGDPNSVLWHYRAMLAFRKLHPALRQGSIQTLDAPDGVLAFYRADPKEKLLCVFNMTEREANYRVPVSTKPSEAPGIVDEPQGGILSLPPLSAYIGLV
jgi:alpha-glucosidase